MTSSGFVRSGSADIYYEVYGSGEPLIFLHGNGETMRYFDPQIEYFSKNYMPVMIDSRGHGKSSRGSERLTLSLLADDAAAVMDALGIQTAAVIGFSDGGNIALTIALKYPGRFPRMVLVGANLYPAGVKSSYQLPIVLLYALLCAFSPFSRAIRMKREIIGLMVNEPRLASEDVAKIDCPALILAGERDMIRDSHTRMIGGLIKRSELRIIAGGDHFLSSKMPDIFNGVVSDFLRRYIAG